LPDLFDPFFFFLTFPLLFPDTSQEILIFCPAGIELVLFKLFIFLSSAKVTNEENYLFMKMARAAFGTNNVDHCARL